jgi:hypothetical protein
MGQSCTTVPTGPATVTLRRAGGNMLATTNVTISAGVEYIALAVLDRMTMMAAINGGDLQSVLPNAKCSAVDYKDFFMPATPDGGAPPPRPTPPPRHPPTRCAVPAGSGLHDLPVEGRLRSLRLEPVL